MSGARSRASYDRGMRSSRRGALAALVAGVAIAWGGRLLPAADDQEGDGGEHADASASITPPAGGDRARRVAGVAARDAAADAAFDGGDAGDAALDAPLGARAGGVFDPS